MSTSTAYAASGGSFTFETTGLTFGTGSTQLATDGGALRMSNLAGNRISGRLDLATSPYPAGSTLYTSFLLEVVSQGTSTIDDVFRQSFSNDTSTSTQRFRLDPISGSGSSDNVGVVYTGTTTTGASGAVALGTRYIFLGRFTRVGSTLSSGSPGVATLYMLTESQFNNFRAGGGLTDAELDAATVGASATQVSGKATHPVTTGAFGLFDGLYLQIASGGSGANLVTLFDEFRAGDSYDAVTPIPEPSALALLTGLSLACRRRRSN